MFRNYMATALNNLVRNRLYAAISILSLAIGMAAAILTFLFVRDELTFDRFVPDRQRIFVVETSDATAGVRQGAAAADSVIGPWMRSGFPEVQHVARYRREVVFVEQHDFAVTDNLAWVDPDFFSIFRLKTLAGDADAAVRRPDGLVLTRSAARKYFGSDAALGRDLRVQLNTSPETPLFANLKVGAVIEDLPSNANITVTLFASGLSPVSAESRTDADRYTPGTNLADFPTYVELANPRQAAEVDRRLQALVRERMFPPPILSETPDGKTTRLSLTPIDQMHLLADRRAEVPAANPALLSALAATALLILFAAGLNFVNLATARAARRSTEVGVRKVSGAARHQLMLQFLGESLIYAAVAGVLAVALAEAGLPGLDGFVRRSIRFPYWSDPELMGLIAGLILAVGLLAGLYPALVLSSFRPSAAFKPGATAGGGRQVLRRGLVVVQFALLIGLLSSILVIANQTRFALNKGTGLDIDQVVRLAWPQCNGDFADRLRRIPGIRAMACASRLAMGQGDITTPVKKPDGQLQEVGFKPIDYGFLELYGVHPLAGRLPSRNHGGDSVRPGDPQGFTAVPQGAVVNAAMVRALGLASPQAAVGVAFQYANEPNRYRRVQIIGVIPDYAYDLTRVPVEPAFFPVVPDDDGDLSVKIAADHVPETLAAIDAAWKASGQRIPLRRRFTSEYLNTVYAGVIREGWLIGALAGVAVLIAAMGLFGTAAFTAEQRTKEIGVRKAMGASTGIVLRLMLWSFAQPVLWANLIAWPAGWWLMQRWLQGFSARIDLSPWYFIGAGGAALLIAALTVGAHALHAARTLPARALRYE